MNRGRITRKVVGCIVMMALVFAQLAVAAHACPLDGGSAAAAVVDAGSGCDEMAHGMTTVCERHCHDAAGTQPAHDLPLAEPACTVSLHPYDAPAAPQGWPREPALQRAISPPLNLSHCVLRL